MALFQVKPTIEGEWCTLRPFSLDDIDAIGAILADPELLRLTGSVHTTAEAEGDDGQLSEETRRWYETRVEQTDRLDLAVIDHASSRCVGEVVLNEWRPEDDACNFRILIGPEGRDRGIGSEATRLVIDHAFRTTNLNRIGLEVYAFNPRAQRSYEKAGFVVEGRQRKAFRFDGEYIDAIIMSILRSEWESLAPYAAQNLEN